MRRNYFLVVMALAMMAISCTKETSVENGNGANAGNGGGTGGGGTGGGTGNGLLYKTVTVTSASGSANETMTTLFYYDAQSRLAADSTYGKSGGMDVTIYRKIYRDAQGRIVKIAQKMTQTGIAMDTSYTTAYYPNSTTLQPSYTIAEVSLMGFTTTDSSVFKYNGVKVASIESYMGSNILGPPTDTSSKWVFTYDAQDYLVNQKNYSDLSTTGNGVMQYVANYDFTYNTTVEDPQLTTSPAQNYLLKGTPHLKTTAMTKMAMQDITMPSNSFTLNSTFTLGSNGKVATSQTITTPANRTSNTTYYY